MNSELMKIILEAIVAVAAVLITGYLIPWLKGMIGEDKFALLISYITYAIHAAEQVYTPEQWQEKKNYVLDYVRNKAEEIGISLSDNDIENLIEGLVNRIKG